MNGRHVWWFYCLASVVAELWLILAAFKEDVKNLVSEPQRSSICHFHLRLYVSFWTFLLPLWLPPPPPHPPVGPASKPAANTNNSKTEVCFHCSRQSCWSSSSFSSPPRNFIYLFLLCFSWGLFLRQIFFLLSSETMLILQDAAV